MVSCVGTYLLLIPYDGNDVGAHIPDAMRKLTGGFRVFTYGADATGMFYESDTIPLAGPAADVSNFLLNINLDSSRSGNPTAYENRPASISVSFFISY